MIAMGLTVASTVEVTHLLLARDGAICGDPDAVVDARLRVQGIEDLRIADASETAQAVAAGAATEG